MKKENYRQAIHFLFGNIMIAIVVLAGTQFALPIAGIALILGFALSRQIVKNAKHPLKEVVCLVEREDECDIPGKAAFMLFLGIFLTLLLFQNKTIVIAALVAVTYLDSISTIAGKKFGKTKLLGDRTVMGSIAGMTGSFLMLATFMNFGLALLTAIIAMLAEYLPIDDNISIPLVTAAILSFVI